MNITITKPAEKPRIETIDAQHVFTPEERNDLGNNLARSTQELAAVESQRKQVAADYKAKSDRIEAQSTELAIKISNGYEMRPTDCFVTMDPKAGNKRYLRRVVNKDEKTGMAVVTAGEVVKEEAMQPNDFEQNLLLYERNYIFKPHPSAPYLVCVNPLRVVIEGVEIKFAMSQGKWIYIFGEELILMTKDEYDSFKQALAEAITEDAWNAADSKILDTQGDEVIAAVIKDNDALLPDAVITVALRDKK